jgi:hypothetical protein
VPVTPERTSNEAAPQSGGILLLVEQRVDRKENRICLFRGRVLHLLIGAFAFEWLLLHRAT